MNMISCKCLNIIIEMDPLNIPLVNKEQLNLTLEEKEDSFFREGELLQIEKFNITKSVPCLVESRVVGSWIVYYCINCRILTHALHKDKRYSYVLAKSNLLSYDEMKKLKNSRSYSKIYAIVIDTDEYDDTNEDTFYPSELEPLLIDLKQTLIDSLRKEADLVKEKIRIFTEEQYSKLDELRDRLHNEERVLIRNLASHIGNSGKEFGKLKTNIAYNDNIMKLQSRENFDESSSSTRNDLKQVKERKKTAPIRNNYGFLFEFDGIDDDSSEKEDDVEGADDDDTYKRSRDHSGSRSNSISIAKSLPMDIPVFMSAKSNADGECVDDNIMLMDGESNVDIAASIKKIAKSVHGGEIFGDLPRPRLHTQL